MKIGWVLDWWKRFNSFIQKSSMTGQMFNSTFLQYWYCQNWSYERWIQEYQMLQKIGINEVILQSVANTKQHYVLYPTKMKGYTCSSLNMLETSLSAADSVGMKVRIGLGFNSDWWSALAHKQEWLEFEARENSRIVTELMDMYCGHRSLAGWYIPYEFHSLQAGTPDQIRNLNRFYRQIAEAIKLKCPATIMVAPFYDVRLSGPVTLSLWSNIIRHVFKDTGIDILALQDSVGVGMNTLEDLDEIYAYTKKATEKIGLTLYAVTETFEEKAGKNLPAPQRRIAKQIAKESAYVGKFVAFSISHYQNGNVPAQINHYEEYYKYYLDQLK